MDKVLIKDLIVENQEFVENVSVLPRTVKIEKQGNYVFVGLRRAGKTYLMYQRIRELLNEGTTVKEILYINFEDERLSEIRVGDLSVILDCYREMFDHRPIVFLDEIQLIEGWEKFARRLADTGYRVYLTGSNARMLSSEIATTLGGRFLIQTVYPYSFSEFLESQGITLRKNMEYGSMRLKLKKLFATWFYYGGLPEVQRFDDKRQWLNSLYQKIFFGDLIARYEIRNQFALKIIVKKMAESVMAPLSYSRLANIVISTGAKIGRSTVIDYVDHLLETWIAFAVPNITAKLAEKESNRKFYFCDNGILNLFLFNPETRLLENIVAITLKRLYGDDLCFYNHNIEIDFYIPSERWAIQVSYSLSDRDTEKRETVALAKFSRFMPAERLTIITYDEERLIETEGIAIEVISAWKWLLSISVPGI
ncbi:MAG: ATP-binding protein [Tannerellaceae bacterium]|jgi:predicted AAA+ superfamily ATPase|nr:ATP-binding protein [Tannerellaceae bacterium]